MLNHIKKIFIFTISFFSIFELYSYSPSELAKNDVVLYTEISSYQRLISRMKTFYLNFRKPGGDVEWQMFQNKIKEETGIDFLNTKTVSNLGVDIDKSLAFAVSMKDKEMQDADIYLWIPARNSYSLYQNLKKIVVEIDKKNRGPQNNSPAGYKELKSNKLLMIGNEETYIAKSVGFIVITTDKNYALNPEKQPKPLSETEKYQLVRKNYPENKQDAIFLIDYSLIADTALARSAYMYGNMSAETEKEYLKELKENLISMGGMFDINPKDFQLQFTYFYKNGYLQDKTKMMPKLLMNSTPPLTIDYFKKNPILYLTLKVNLPELFNLMMKMDPSIKESINEINTGFSDDTGLDIQKDFIESITGRASAIIGNIPPEAQLEDFNAWEGYLSFGTKKGSYDKFFKILNTIQKKNNDPNIKIHSKKLGSQMSLWTFEATINKNTDNNTTVAKKNNVYVFLKDSEIIISSRQEKWLEQKGTGTDLIQKLISKNENKTSGFMYINVESVVNYLKSTSYGMMLNMYLVYFQNIKDIYIYSFTETDKSISDFVLRLK